MLLRAGVGMDDLTSRMKHRVLAMERRAGVAAALALATGALGALAAIALPAPARAGDITVLPRLPVDRLKQ